MRSLAVAVSAWLAAATAAFAQTPHRMVAVTFDDLPYQASAEALCDPETALRLTTDFLAMLRPLETHGTAFVNEGKGCDATRAALTPTILSAWLEAGLDLGNHTASHINIHRNTVETYLADVDAGGDLHPRGAGGAGTAAALVPPPLSLDRRDVAEEGGDRRGPGRARL